VVELEDTALKISMDNEADFNPVLWLLVGYLFLMIFRPFEYWTWLESFHIERIYMILTILVAAIWPGKVYRHYAITTFLLIFFLVICFSFLTAYDPIKTKNQIWEYFKQIVLYFLIIISVRNEKELKILLTGFIAVTGIYIGKSLWEFFINGRHAYRQGIRRLIGIDQTYSNPNTFAATVVYSLPLAWALFKSKLHKYLGILLIFYFIMSVVAIGLTGSRSGMLSFIFFLFLVWYREKKKLIGIILGALVLTTSWIVLPYQYKVRFETIFNDSINPIATESAKSRIVHLKWGIQLFKMRPIWGWGAGNAPVITYDIMGAEQPIQLHNLYAQLLAELGFIGLVSFGLMIFSIYYMGKKILFISKMLNIDNKFIIEIVLASFNIINIMLFNGLFGHNLYRYTWLFVTAVVALCYQIILTKLALFTSQQDSRDKAINL